METDLSPGALLASCSSKIEYSPQLILITGESGSGKTTWCVELIRQARLAGISPCGLVSPAVYESGRKTGIDLQLIQTGERRRLAFPRANANQVWCSGPATPGWQFDAGVLEWGNLCLDQLGVVDLLVIDELGPLELLENQGLVQGLALIAERNYHLACAVVRPSLLATAQERWPWGVVLGVSKSFPAQGYEV